MNDNPLETFLNKHALRADKYRNLLEEMLAHQEAYSYAEKTLSGIWDYIDQYDSITDSQIEAIENIRLKPSIGYGVQNTISNSETS